jgi:beta-glucosidase
LLLGALTESEKISLLEGDDLAGVGGGPDQHTGTADGIARLGVPTVHFTDGTAGIRQGAATAMPVSLAVAATFDPGLARLDGAVLGVEARDKGQGTRDKGNVDAVPTLIAVAYLIIWS